MTLISDDVLADTSVSVREEVPVLALHTVTDKGAPLVNPVVHQDIRQIRDELFSQDERTDEVSGFSLPMCGLLIHRGTSDMGLSHGDTRWFCLLSSAAAGSAMDRAFAVGVDGQCLDHWRGVVWDPGNVGQQCICVCYDCLC